MDGAFRFAVSDLVNFRVPNFIRSKLLSVLYPVIIGLPVRLALGVLLASPLSTIYKVYNTVVERLATTTKTFVLTCNSLLTKLRYIHSQVIGGLVGSAMACRLLDRY